MRPLKLLNWNVLKHFWEYFLFLYSCTEEMNLVAAVNLHLTFWNPCEFAGIEAAVCLLITSLPYSMICDVNFLLSSNNLQLEYSKSIIYAARLTLNYAVLLPWKPLTTYYCLVWQITSASFSLMSAISKALLCQTKGLCVQCLVFNHGKWQMTRENC